MRPMRHPLRRGGTLCMEPARLHLSSVSCFRSFHVDSTLELFSVYLPTSSYLRHLHTKSDFFQNFFFLISCSPRNGSILSPTQPTNAYSHMLKHLFVQSTNLTLHFPICIGINRFIHINRSSVVYGFCLTKSTPFLMLVIKVSLAFLTNSSS